MKKRSSLRGIVLASATLVSTLSPHVLGAHSVSPLGSTLSPTDLVNSLVGGTGITVTPGSVTYTGADSASGTFTGATASTGLPFASGILLTSGSVYNSIGPNTDDAITTDNQLPGSSFIQTVTGIDQGYDAALLSFKFTSSQNQFSFRYVFASDEYNEWAPSAYNDVFAFILSDMAGANVNLAVLPDTSPVSVNNVRLDLNSQYYFDNSIGAGAPYDIQYDGLVGRNAGFSLSAVGNVVPGQEYTITLAISDTGDAVLDSGVFLKAGSFIAGPQPPDDEGETPVPETGSLLATAILVAMVFFKSRESRRMEE